MCNFWIINWSCQKLGKETPSLVLYFYNTDNEWLLLCLIQGKIKHIYKIYMTFCYIGFEPTYEIVFVSTRNGPRNFSTNSSLSSSGWLMFLLWFYNMKKKCKATIRTLISLMIAEMNLLKCCDNCSWGQTNIHMWDSTWNNKISYFLKTI